MLDLEVGCDIVVESSSWEDEGIVDDDIDIASGLACVETPFAALQSSLVTTLRPTVAKAIDVERRSTETFSSGYLSDVDSQSVEPASPQSSSSGLSLPPPSEPHSPIGAIQPSTSKESTTKDNNEDSTSFKEGPSQQFCCKWTHCDWPGNYDDLVDHIREIHVELQPYQQQRHNWSDHHKPPTATVTDKQDPTQIYVCLWEGCKVYGKSSLSRNWLERHVLAHSGPRPFKCIVEDCGARFKMQSALARHVNTHFKPNLELCSNSSASNHHDLTDVINGSLSNGAAQAADQSITSSTFSTSFGSAFSKEQLGAPNGTVFRMPNGNSLSSQPHATMMRAKFDFTSANGHSNGTPNKILKRKKSDVKRKKRCIIGK